MILRVTHLNSTGKLVESTGYDLPTQAHYAAEDLARVHGWARLDVVREGVPDASGVTTSLVETLAQYGHPE